MSQATKTAEQLLSNYIESLCTKALSATGKTAFMAILTEVAQLEIAYDIAIRRYTARSIKSFGDLHTYVDANEYGGLCRDGIITKANMLMPLRADDGTLSTQEFMDAANKLQNDCNAWAQSEQFKTAKWAYF